LRNVPGSQRLRHESKGGTLIIAMTLKIIRIGILDSWIGEVPWLRGNKSVSGTQTGGWAPGQSDAPWEPGGECFAPIWTWGTPPQWRIRVPSTLLQVNPGKIMENRSADLSRGVLDCPILEGLPSLNGFVLKPHRTYFVSHCKTNHSRAEVLISGTLRVGGVRGRGAPNFSSEKQVLFAFALRSSNYYICSVWRPDGHKRTSFIVLFELTFFCSEGPFVTNLNGPKLLPLWALRHYECSSLRVVSSQTLQM